MFRLTCGPHLHELLLPAGGLSVCLLTAISELRLNSWAVAEIPSSSVNKFGLTLAEVLPTYPVSDVVHMGLLLYVD